MEMASKKFYFPTSGKRLPEPKAFGEILNTGGA